MTTLAHSVTSPHDSALPAHNAPPTSHQMTSAPPLPTSHAGGECTAEKYQGQKGSQKGFEKEKDMIPGPLAKMCHLSQGEVTNVSVLASSSPSHSDQEIVDVGSRDDMLKTMMVSKDTISKSKKSVADNSVVKKKMKIDDGNTSNLLLNDLTDKQKKKRRLAYLKQKAQKLISSKTKSDKKTDNLEQIFKSIKLLESKLKNLQPQKETKTTKESKVGKDSTKQLTKQSQSKESRKGSSSEKVEVKVAEGSEQPTVERVWHHGWKWDGEGTYKKVTNIVST